MNKTHTIVGLMAFAAVFALIGNVKNGDKAGTDVKIFLGAGLGAVLLSLVAEAGDEAATFAVGLAGITLLASVLKNGMPVFAALTKVTGGVNSLGSTTTKTAVPVQAKAA